MQSFLDLLVIRRLCKLELKLDCRFHARGLLIFWYLHTVRVRAQAKMLVSCQTFLDLLVLRIPHESELKLSCRFYDLLIIRALYELEFKPKCQSHARGLLSFWYSHTVRVVNAW
jgi:hypothetical protein